MKASAVVKTAREHLGLTQAQFGALLGRHPVTVWKWEKGEWTPPEHDLGLAQAMLASKLKRAAHLLETRGPIYCLTRILRH